MSSRKPIFNMVNRTGLRTHQRLLVSSPAKDCRPRHVEPPNGYPLPPVRVSVSNTTPVQWREASASSKPPKLFNAAELAPVAPGPLGSENAGIALEGGLGGRKGAN